MQFDLVAHLYRQRAFSRATFGPGARTQGVLDHIRKEMVEIESKPSDLMEWVDMILLSLDGAWRAGHAPETIAMAIASKQGKNELRDWPDWRTADPNKAIEHVRVPAAVPCPTCNGQKKVRGTVSDNWSDCPTCVRLVMPPGSIEPLTAQAEAIMPLQRHCQSRRGDCPSPFLCRVHCVCATWPEPSDEGSGP